MTVIKNIYWIWETPECGFNKHIAVLLMLRLKSPRKSQTYIHGLVLETGKMTGSSFPALWFQLLCVFHFFFVNSLIPQPHFFMIY